jgi:1-acyl-sn-glycerol-3-phosphate acyltransferase
MSEETRGEKIGRRLKTVPTRYIGLLLLTVLFPVLLAAALVTDVVRKLIGRRPFMATRLLVMGWIYFAGESFCIALFGLTWLLTLGPRRAERMERSAWRIQQFWTASLLRPLIALCNLNFTIEGADQAEPGPVLVFIRHVSIIDNLLPGVVVAGPHDLNLRYLIKRELRSDPGLDIGGDRLQNYFVRRGTGQEIERENVRRLSEGLGPKDGMLIFPEGTRFTPERRARAIEKLAERDAALAASAERMQYVLPPKPGGVLAILEGAPDADVLLLAHAGFDGLRLISDIWHGDLIGRDIRVKLIRIPRSEIPADPGAQVTWLFETWESVDRWVGEQLAARDSS